MKKNICKFLSLLLVLMLVTGCSSNAEETETPDEEEEVTEVTEPIVMRCGHIFSADSARGIAYLEFEKAVEERSNGAIDVEVYHDASLGDEREMTEMVKSGALECVRTGHFEAVAPKTMIYSMPFLFADQDEFNTIAYGEVGEALVDDARENNVVVLATGSSGGFRQFTNNVRPITSVEDFEGIKMRVPPIESFVQTMKSCGASVVSIAMVEVYMSLKTSVADGQENPFIYIDQMKFYEVQEYLSVGNYSIPAQLFTVNADWYDSLSPELQTIVKEEAINCQKLNDELELEANMESYEMLKEEMEVNVISDEELVKFAEACQGVYDYHIEEGFFTQEDVDLIYAALGK